MKRQRVLFNIQCYGITLLLTTFLSGSGPSKTFAEAPSNFRPSIQETYVKTALPIFKQSCFACHGPQAQNLDHIHDPALKKSVGRTIASAQDMLQMGEIFPLSENEDSKAELKDIVEALQKGWMPPEEQKTFNLGSPLNDADKKMILDWAQKTIKALEKK
jgi:hypothetical protein